MDEDALDPRPGAGLESAEALEEPPTDEDNVSAPAPGGPPPTDPAAAAGASRGRSRKRWIAAALVVLAVAAASAAAVMFLGAKPLPEALRFIPSDSVLVVEFRPELPGDQRQHLGNLLAHFPGFSDQSTLNVKIDEALDRIVRRAGNGALDYVTQVKPLLAGPLAVAMTGADVGALGAGKAPDGLLLVATTDGKATCQSISGGSSANGETYRAVQLTMIGPNASIACALDGRFMLLGTTTAIKSGIDARLDNKGIDGNATFRSTRGQLSGDQIVLVYLDGRVVGGALKAAVPSLGLPATVVDAFPEWVVAGVRVVDDAMQVEMVTPPLATPALASGLPSEPPPEKSHFAAMLPPDAFGFVEAHGIGANIQRVLAQLKTDPAQATTLQTLEQALTSVGGVNNLSGWIEDLGIAGVPVGDGAGAVILLRGTDATTAQSRFAQLRNLLTLASTGTDITIRTADHNGLSVTTVDLGELGPTLQALGAPAGLLGNGLRLSFSMAVKSDVLMLGLGDGVIERVLDVDPAASLASSGTYGHAVALAGTPNDVELFVAVDTLAGWLESHAPAGFDLQDYRTNIKPYFEHVAGMVESSVTSATGTRARIVLTVK